jgi:hypothetical protein
MRVPILPPPLVKPGGIAEAIADSLETQFQPVNDTSKSVFIEKVKEVLKAYFFTPAS